MKFILTANEWNNIRLNDKLDKKTLGFVPTMGTLHKGHQSLIIRSLDENDSTAVSIFINPTQFNDSEDYKHYPKEHEKDFELLVKMGVDYIFYPSYSELYPDGYRYKVVETSFSKQLCGTSRPGHFEGVLTVVMKLMNIIRPAKSYFGEKDYQQYILIKDMCKAFFIPTEVIVCPTIRDENGLALSTRNELLLCPEKKLAAIFHGLLKSDKSIIEIKHELEKLGFIVDYIEELNGRRFGAVYIDKVRLIDNV